MYPAMFVTLSGLAACNPQDGEQRLAVDVNPGSTTQPVSTASLNIVQQQRLYVPAYSQIYVLDVNRSMNLAITLSIRNTDPNHPIVIESVRYYNSAGEQVKEYLDSPQQLAPMATTDFVVAEYDREGGTGANFVVEWGAEQAVFEPIVEAVMVSAGTQGISFTSRGAVISEE